MSTTVYILGALGLLVFLVLLVLSCLPSPTVREVLRRLQQGRRRRGPK